MLFATAWLVATFWWLFISMHVYGGLPAPLAVAAVLALAAFLGSYYAVAAWGWQRLRPAGAAGGALLFFAALLLAELARGWLWAGFPRGAGGSGHVGWPSIGKGHTWKPAALLTHVPASPLEIKKGCASP